MGALTGVTVVEWGSYVSAPYCTRLLADFGARVYKVEPPAGDESRAYGPFPGDRPDPERSGLYLHLNAGKVGVTLDPERPSGLALLGRLLERADVFVSNCPIALRRRLGLDYEALHRHFPALTVVGVTIFGDSGPSSEAPAYDIDANAVSGVSWAIGRPEREPLIVPFSQAEYQAGAQAAAATVVALLARRGSGPGQQVDVAAADALATYAGTNSAIYVFHGLRWARAGHRAYGSGGPYPYVILPCRDGSVVLIGRARHEWDRLVEAMGRPAWTGDPRYQDLIAMGRDYPDEVDARLLPWLRERTRAELLQIAARYNVPIGPLRTIDEVVAEPQFAHRGFFSTIADERYGTITMPGRPYRLSATPVRPLTRAPRLGEHNVEVFCGELGLAPDALADLRRAGVV